MENNRDKDILQDIRDRTIRLETKLDNMEELKTDIKEVTKTANGAMEQSSQNKLDIARMSGNITWLWRGVATGVVGLVGSIVYWAFQRLAG